jgi:hypothetical protein
VFPQVVLGGKRQTPQILHGADLLQIQGHFLESPVIVIRPGSLKERLPQSLALEGFQTFPVHGLQFLFPIHDEPPSSVVSGMSPSPANVLPLEDNLIKIKKGVNTI